MSNETTIIPSTELVGLEKTLSDVEQLTRQLNPLREKAKSTKVEYPDRAAYQAIGEVLSQERLLRKQGEAHFGPFNIITERVRTFLRTQLLKHTNVCEEIDGICRAKMKPWEQAELEASKAEQVALNKKAEKRGEAPVTVAPDIPSTPGYRRSTTYPIEVHDAGALLRAFLTAYKKTDSNRVQYLRKFITLDIKALAAEARDMKDPEKFMKLLPGVRCWKD